jgi:hypothetical protein
MKNSHPNLDLSLPNKDHQRDRLKHISLKWSKIANEKTKEESSTRNMASAMPGGLIRYEFEAMPPEHFITISMDVNASEVELALATNGTSLRCATLTALLAAMVVDDAAGWKCAS